MNNKLKAFLRASLLAFMICAGLPAHAAQSQLNITASGALPNGVVTLIAGASQKLTAKIDPKGSFQFSNLSYNAEAPLLLSLNIPVGKERLLHINELAYLINPDTGVVEFRGKVTRAANVILNVDGSQAKAAISNAAGFFEMDVDAARKLSLGESGFITSVINVNETCCPRVMLPLGALTLKISSTPVLIKKTASFSTTTHMTSPTTWAVSVPQDLMNRWRAGVQGVATELSANLAAQTASLGTFFDAKTQLDTMRTLQEMQARAIKDYTPGEALCRFGSMSQNLADSDMRARATQIALSELMLDRNLGRAGTSFAENASGSDGQLARVRLFQSTFCRTVDSNNALASFCEPITSSTQIKDQRINRDVDYVRSFDSPLTLDFDLTDNSTTRREGDILALGLNLFATDALDRINAASLAKGTSSDTLQALRATYASRNVARNSFAAIAGEKGEGVTGSGNFVRAVMQNMGMSDSEAKRFVGENPSYFAQMEILTKRMYQDPLFYAELMDKPANVERQRVAIKAISLMQQRDLLESLQRREMILSQILEMEVRKRADKINKGIVTAK